MSHPTRPPSQRASAKLSPTGMPGRGGSRDEIRDAATVILLRRDAGTTRVLMGQRGAGAAFMASKFVFPGGAVDADDALVAPARPLPPQTARRLAEGVTPALAQALAMAAIRELWEEAGLALAVGEGPVPKPVPPAWQGFFAAGHRPAADALDFVFRAITPPGRPRRFDARFFIADAAHIAGDPDDFTAADAELAHLTWFTLDEARHLDLPFITRVVLAEIAARLNDRMAAGPVPFLHHEDQRSFIDPL